MRPQRPEIKTISSNEAKQRWGSVINAVVKDGNEVVVESHGKPTVAVISYDEFIEYRAARDRKHREEALARLRAMEKRQVERNSDLTEEEIERIALEVGREINERVYQRYRAGLLDRPEIEPE